MSAQPDQPFQRRRLEVEDFGDITVVNFTDKKILSKQNIQVIGAQLISLVDELRRRKVVVNFQNVEYFSSAAIWTFDTLREKLKSTGGRLVLCSMHPWIYEVFEITKRVEHFEILKDENEARVLLTSDS